MNQQSDSSVWNLGGEKRFQQNLSVISAAQGCTVYICLSLVIIIYYPIDMAEGAAPFSDDLFRGHNIGSTTTEWTNNINLEWNVASWETTMFTRGF